MQSKPLNNTSINSATVTEQLLVRNTPHLETNPPRPPRTPSNPRLKLQVHLFLTIFSQISRRQLNPA